MKHILRLTLACALWSGSAVLTAQTGIFVDQPKVYDDQSLTTMLNAAKAQLGALRPIDQTTLLGHIGAVQGANLSQSGFALQVNGPPTIGNALTTTSGTPSSVQTLGTTTMIGGSTPGTTISNQNQITTPGLTTQNVATLPSVTPTVPTAPAPTTTLPTTFSTSATDTLNEEMQLTYEIANLELLLEGSLSDGFMPGIGQKTRTTIGFPISITPPKDKRFENALAEVEVTVSNSGPVMALQPPGLVSILPREKTYNVANITDRSASIGGGVVTQVASVGATWMWGHKTYYLVRDQDTVAFQGHTEGQQIRFGWQFRPVLGQKYVQAGLRQTFAQLAFPTQNPVLPGTTTQLGTAIVTVKWRKYDPKTGAVGAVISSESSGPYPLDKFSSDAVVDAVTTEDIGGGMITVSVAGDFLPGTRVRMGSTFLDSSLPDFSMTISSLQFTVPAALAATDRIVFVSRSGTELELIVPGVTTAGPGPQEVAISNVDVQPFTDTQSTVSVTLSVPVGGSACRWVAVIGNKVFGCSDSPFLANPTNNPNILSFRVPNTLIDSNPVVTVKRLFSGPRFTAQRSIPLPPQYAIAKVSLLSTGDPTVFAVSGAGVDHLRVLAPSSGVQVALVTPANGTGPADTTTVLLRVPKAQLSGLKQFALQVGNAAPTVIAVPGDAVSDPKPSLKAQDPIAPGTGVTLTITGTGLEKVKAIKYLKTTLSFRLAIDKSSLMVDLPAQVTSSEGIRFLDVTFTDGTTARYEVDVKKKG